MIRSLPVRSASSMLVVCFFASSAAAVAEKPAPPLRYVVVATGRPSGSSVTTVAADGTRDTAYEYIENGRGPKLHIRASRRPDGVLSRLVVSGHDTMGVAVDERFTLEGGRASWKSLAESGEKPQSSPAFYVPLQPLPETLGLLAAALRQAGGTLPLLPDGEARLESLGETTVRGRGGQRHIQGYAITGLDLVPTPVWLDDDGALFGTFDSWMSCVREGWEEAIDSIVALQKRHEVTRSEAIARRLAHHPPVAGLAFTHARVFDSGSLRWLPDHTVVVAGGRIAALGPSATTRAPAGAEVVDATGKALLPGLWDMHAHLGPGQGELDVASGVTTVRDVGNDPDQLDDYKKRFDDGTMVGPHVLRSGFIEGRGPNASSSKVTAETEAEARAAVEFFARRGYEGIKIYNSVKPELVPILAREAHARGLRVSGHVPVHLRAEEVVRDGYDEIHHINMLFLNFFVDKDTDTRTTLRFTLVAEKAAGLDLASRPVKDFIALLLKRKTVVDPTINVFEDLFLDRLGELAPGVRSVASRLPVQVRRGYLGGGLPVPDGKDALYRQSFAAALRLIKALHDAGVPLVAGTDSMAGLMLHRELELDVAAGIPPAEVLRLATLGSARVVGRDRSSGSIAVGKDADLVLVDGDPIARIEDVRKVVTVVRGGVVFPSAELYRSASVLPAR